MRSDKMLPNLPWKTAGGHVFWETLESRNSWKLHATSLRIITS